MSHIHRWSAGAWVIFLTLLGPWPMAWTKDKEPLNQPGGQCPHQSVEPRAGSKILFPQDFADLGEIPYDRWVTHLFTYRNVGTVPLSVAPHVKSKVIEGC